MSNNYNTVKKENDQVKKNFKKDWKKKIVPRDWRVKEEKASKITVKVSVPALDPIKIKTTTTTKVSDFKKDIKPKIGYFPSQYRLQHNGVYLDDLNTLSFYKIKNSDSINVVLHQGLNGYQTEEGSVFNGEYQ
eukprot:TRINITY_DN732_c1_g1_i2.p1 TRINITY_DN732_c1_g1~~TRINITY_DN732_c1_g1_i2.p1  ORF type:complete len:133 (-),score=35.40 TRINITY_DN732_c1_g1_i2:112-510(-)